MDDQPSPEWIASIKAEAARLEADDNAMHNNLMHESILTTWRVHSPRMWERLTAVNLADPLARVLQARMWDRQKALIQGGMPVMDAREMAEREHLMLEPELHEPDPAFDDTGVNPKHEYGADAEDEVDDTADAEATSETATGPGVNSRAGGLTSDLIRLGRRHLDEPDEARQERLVLFTKQPANLPLTYVHTDGKQYEPGCGIAMQTDANLERVGACREIDIVFGEVWIRADIVAARKNAESGVDVFYNCARRLTGTPPRRAPGPGYVRYVHVATGDEAADEWQNRV